VFSGEGKYVVHQRRQIRLFIYGIVTAMKTGIESGCLNIKPTVRTWFSLKQKGIFLNSAVGCLSKGESTIVLPEIFICLGGIENPGIHPWPGQMNSLLSTAEKKKNTG
jgi:hypothetical protein